MTHREIAQQILAAVGGPNNIQTMSHCMTRIRFKLHNISVAQSDSIKNLPGVLTVVESAGQYQIVMGKQLMATYQEIEQLLRPVINSEPESVKASVLSRTFDTIISIITPLLGVLIASAVLKGITSVAVVLNILTNDSSTYLVLSAIADSILYYLPFLVALTASKQFQLSPFIGLGLTAVLFAPTLLVDKIQHLEPIYSLFSGTLFELPVYFTLFDLPIVAANYSGALLPVIAICYCASLVEKFFDRRFFGTLKHVFLPATVILSLAPIILVLIGPAMHVLGLGFLQVITDLIAWSPLLAGLIMGGTWQILIAGGLHWVLSPIFLLNLTNQGFDNLFVLTTATVFAQSGAVLGVLLKTKDRNVRKISLPIMISGLFGITEPAIYGITLPRKSPFIISCLVGGIGGAIIAVLGVKKYVLYGFGVLTFPSLINPVGENDWRILLVVLICFGAFVITAVATMLFYHEKSDAKDLTDEVNPDSEIIFAPQSGVIAPLVEAQNPIFASGVMGKGCIIQTQQSQFFTPTAGVIKAVFAHSAGVEMTTQSGAQILLQLETDDSPTEVRLLVETGDHVQVGTALFEVITPSKNQCQLLVVILNSERYESVTVHERKKIKKAQPLIELALSEQVEVMPPHQEQALQFSALP
ncbi:MAG: PTS transporter subunit EIIC [Culicoidibacterales bacterium]